MLLFNFVVPVATRLPTIRSPSKNPPPRTEKVLAGLVVPTPTLPKKTEVPPTVSVEDAERAPAIVKLALTVLEPRDINPPSNWARLATNSVEDALRGPAT